MLKFTIPLEPRTKKNSSRIVRNRYTGKSFLRPSESFERYQNECAYFIPKLDKPIDYPVNVKAVYYMKTKRKVDITNLESASLDIMVHYGVLADDNSRIVVSTDGSRVGYSKNNSRTEVTITKVSDDEVLKWVEK